MYSMTDIAVEQWHSIARHGGTQRLEQLSNHTGPQHAAIYDALSGLKPESVLEIGSSVGVNLVGAVGMGSRVCGIDIDIGASALAAQYIPGVFITGDFRSVLPILAPKSWDVGLSCYTLAYVSPHEVEAVLHALVAVIRRALILSEPEPGVSGTPTLWGHDYQELCSRAGLARKSLHPIEPTQGLLSVSVWEAV